MRDRVAGALGLQPAPPTNQPAVQYGGSVSLQQGWTSNVLNAPSTVPESSLFTALTPSISVTADTQRIQGGLSYSPSFIAYEQLPAENTIAQNLVGHAHAILLPDVLFLDVSALAMQQSITGGLGPTGTIVANQSNTMQDYALTISPYMMQRLGDLAVLQIGGSLTEAVQSLPGGSVVATLPGLPASSVAGQNSTTTQEYAALNSGNAFGRWMGNAYLSASQIGGTGVQIGAFQNVASFEAGYSVTRSTILLGTIGWNELHYGGIPPVNINSGLWNVGVQWTPNPDSKITVRYGRSLGIDAPFLSGYYQITARTRITAMYSDTISTDPQQLSNNLNFATTDASGNLVNASTGQPLMAGSNMLGIYGGVYKLTIGSISATLLLDRDVFQIGFNYQNQKSLNSAQLNAYLLNGSGDFGTVSWQHDLSENVKTSVYLQYGVAQSESGGVSQAGTVLTGTAQASYAISRTLFATLQYSHTSSSFNSPSPYFNADTVLVGLTKTF